MSGGVWIYAEHNEGKLKKISFELLGLGKALARGMSRELCAVVVGSGVEGLAAPLGEYGADRVIVAQGDTLAGYTAEGYAKALADLAKEREPAVILLGSTQEGREVAGLAAQKLSAGLMTDCTEVVLEEGRVICTRPVYAGKAFARMASEEPVMATIRPNVFAAADAEAGRTAELEKVAAEAGDLRKIVKDVVIQVSGRPELTEADLIVSGGRGMKGPENFKILEDLADALGAAVGASRAAVDAGWMPQRLQVGQTGKTVSPKIYIACGISGAIQHLAGMGSSKCIIAVNKDPEANIFKVADYGIVGDLFEVVPMLKEELKKTLEK